MIRNSMSVRLWAVILLALGLAALPAFSRLRESLRAGVPPETASPDAAPAASDLDVALKNLEFRNIGPAIMGGRIDDFAVIENTPDTIYVGTAGGGVFKTTNGGTTWTPILDHAVSSSIGALAIAPSNPSIVWVGTGEANNRQSASWGAGVYKSLDGGSTWTSVGLENSNSIGCIVIDPRDSNTVYIAVSGDQWAPSHDRGVYKTTDGGKTWTQSLFISENTGASDIAIDPASPNILYAGAYERRRTVWGFNGGGPEGGVYKTVDGGANWTKLTEGLPYAEGGDVGRVGLSIYRRNSNIVYVRIQHAKGGIFRSDDKGVTWTKMSDFNPRPNYFGRIDIDPNNDLRIWAGGTDLFLSEDGGKSFNIRSAKVHYDNHGFWIDPHDSNHVIAGDDGGIFMTNDGGRTWAHDDVIAIGQFYEVTANNERPYRVCGGLQDNGSWCGPSNSLQNRGIVNSDWLEVSGADGFFNRLDPVDPNVDYVETQDGSLQRRDFRTTEMHSIKPREKQGEAPYRFEWNSPVEISAHDHNTIYFGGNFLFKSTDRGENWTKISPDLTNNEDRAKLEILGKLPTAEELSRNDGVGAWPCITTIGESPMNAQVIYAGTDDGNVQATRDGGKTWTNVISHFPGVQKGAYVSRVVASKYAEGTAYATFDNHRSGDYRVYLFATTDYGQSWKAISNGIIDKDSTLHVVREDPKVPNILYAGTERGLFITYDRGANWMRLNANLPTMPVDDILIHPRDNDMILGTHGRSIWILDDISPIQQLAPQVLSSNLHLFDIRTAYLFRTESDTPPGFGFGWRMFQGPNPPYGALVDFYLKSAPNESQRVTIAISDSSGKTIRDIRCQSPKPDGQQTAPSAEVFANEAACTPKPGVNRVAWDLRYNPAVPPEPPGAAGAAGGGGGGGFGGGRGPLVEPGTYTVKVTAGSDTQTQTVQVEEDPRIQVSAEDRAARHDAIMKLFELSRTATLDQRQINALKVALDAAIAGWKRPNAPKVPDNVQKAADDFSKRVDAERAKYQGAGPGEGGGGAPPTLLARVTRLMGVLENYTAAPTAGEGEEIAELDKKVPVEHEQVQKLVTEDLEGLNKLMNEAGIPHIVVAPATGGGRRGRG